MIPVFVMAAANYLPDSIAEMVHGAVAGSPLGPFLVPYLNPYMSILGAFIIAYFPMGIRLFYQAGGNNNTPRNTVAKLVATNPFVAMLQGCHENAMENAPFFAAGVLSCVQAGVAANLLTAYCCTWLLARVVFMIAYLAGMGTIRTLTWVFTCALQAKLFHLAATASA